MALLKELLNLLDNTEEPLPKRLKIADNAFKSTELPLRQREAFLLKWLSKATKENTKEVWELLLNWLRSAQIQNLNRSEISHDDMRNLLSVITKRMKQTQFDSLITDCIIEIIQNRNFQLFFKHDLKEHCSFIMCIFLMTKNVDELHKLLINEQLFNRNITCSDDFHRYFIENAVIPLSTIVDKFGGDTRVFGDVSQLLGKCLFVKNFKSFSSHYKMLFTDSSEHQFLPGFLFENLHIWCNRSDVGYMIPLIFHAYCKSYSNDFEIIYKFFIVLLQMLGFDMSNYFELASLKRFTNDNFSQKSVETLTRLCGVLTESTVQLTFKIKDKTFTDLLENVTVEILKSLKPCEATFEYLNCIISLNPILVQRQRSEMLTYVLLNSGENLSMYENSLLNVFRVIAKLHDIPKLIPVIFPILKTNSKVNVVIPNSVFKYFSECVALLPSWQVLAIFKTMLSSLDCALTNLGDGENDNYIEVICTFLSNLLSSVRVGEYTVPTDVFKNFLKSMLHLKEILKRFGTTLVSVEHKPILMQMYLNVCYKWGELYIMLSYYSIKDEVVLEKHYDNDVSACNITYLHSYLKRAQWRLIAQRIANFGQKPCKQIMQNLCIQKLRAMLLFEETVNTDIIASVASSVVASLEDQSPELLFNEFVLHNVIIPTTNVDIAKLLVKNVVTSGDYNKLEMFYDNRDVIGEALYICFSKINKAFGKPSRGECYTSKILPCVNKNAFNQHDVAAILMWLQENCLQSKLEVNEDDLSMYMELIRHIPLPQYEDKNLMEGGLLYLTATRFDLQKCVWCDKEVLRKCEGIIIGIAQNFPFIFEKTIIVKIIDTFERYAEVFTLITQAFVKSKVKFDTIHATVEFLTQNISNKRYRDCLIVFLHYMDEFKHSQLSVYSNGLIREEICKSIMPLLKKDSLDVGNLEAYALTLKHYLNLDSQDALNELVPMLDGYFDVVANSNEHINGVVFLLALIVHNKAKQNWINDIVLLKIWNCCLKLKIDSNEHKQFSKVVQTTLQYIDNDTFSNTSSELLQLTKKSILGNKSFTDEIKVWSSISSSNLNAVQTKIWQKTLESLLYETVFTQETNFEDVVELELVFIKNFRLILSPPLMDAVFITISRLISCPVNFYCNFGLSISLLESLLKRRMIVTMDYLPTYLQRYRAALDQLCVRSNSDLNSDVEIVEKLADCAHKFERLTKSLVQCDRHLQRISSYLIADILNQFERVTLYPKVKIHLNNCLYKFVSLCDEHSLAFLKRTLSTASTEMFKDIYGNYNKYYKYTGTV